MATASTIKHDKWKERVAELERTNAELKAKRPEWQGRRLSAAGRLCQ